jgi:bla regulator protein blaR1
MTISQITVSPSLWTAIATPLANHLWQSTLFAAAAGLLTLALKKNQAKARYWIWLIASIKFMLPFSLLIGLGSRLGSSKPPAQTSGFVTVLQQVGQPFIPANATHASTPVATTSQLQWLPLLLLIVWACGGVAVLLFWCVRWRRMSAAVRGAQPMESGREWEMLRLQQGLGAAGKIRLMTSPSVLEPGIFGFLRPVLLLPEGIGDRLTDAQLEAIVRHELCHVRRHDNFSAALHMLIEALFWFHPLIWWIGSRLIDERERACDEDVLRLGSEAQAYAEGILKVCEFYLESPLLCVAGVTGSNLKKRIEAIMVHRIASKLSPAKKLLLAVAAFSVVAIPIAAGMLHPAVSHAQVQAAQAQAQAQAWPPKPGFASAHIMAKGTPTGVVTQRMLTNNGQLDFENRSLKDLIVFAYHVTDTQVSGPEWITSALYDVQVKTNPPASGEQLRLAVQELLPHTFRLTFHRERKEQPAYELVVATNGSKLVEASIDETNKNETKRPKMVIQPVGLLEGNAAKLTYLVQFLETQTGRTVIDKTGLNGTYNFKLDVSSLERQPQSPEAMAAFMRALSGQLGLQLNPTTAFQEMLVVDYAGKISQARLSLPLTSNQ